MHPVSLLFHDVFVNDASESGFNSPAADRYKLSVDEFEAQLGAPNAKRLRPERGAGGKRVEDAPPSEREPGVGPRRALKKDDPAIAHELRKRQANEQRKREQAAKKVQSRISDLENKIAEREQAMKEIEAAMSAPGFYENRDQAQPVIDRHQSLMWELGELMHEWEQLSKDL